MDVDRLSTEEQTKHMAKGRCFECHEIGHMAQDCLNKEQRKKPNQEFGGYKKTPIQHELKSET
jgi:hypothetical protein